MAVLDGERTRPLSHARRVPGDLLERVRRAERVESRLVDVQVRAAAHGPGRTLRAGRSLGASRPFRARRSFCAGRALRAGRPRVPVGPRTPVVPFAPVGPRAPVGPVWLQLTAISPAWHAWPAPVSTTRSAPSGPCAGCVLRQAWMTPLASGMLACTAVATPNAPPATRTRISSRPRVMGGTYCSRPEDARSAPAAGPSRPPGCASRPRASTSRCGRATAPSRRRSRAASAARSFVIPSRDEDEHLPLARGQRREPADRSRRDERRRQTRGRRNVPPPTTAFIARVSSESGASLSTNPRAPASSACSSNSRSRWPV